MTEVKAKPEAKTYRQLLDEAQARREARYGKNNREARRLARIVRRLSAAEYEAALHEKATNPFGRTK